MSTTPRERRREQQRKIDKVSRAFSDTLAEIPANQWQKIIPDQTRLFRNRQFTVHELAPPAYCQEMVICRLLVLPVDTGDLLTDAIGKSQLQLIKDSLGYVAAQAVEVYPTRMHAAKTPFRELWVLRGLLPFDAR